MKVRAIDGQEHFHVTVEICRDGADAYKLLHPLQVHAVVDLVSPVSINNGDPL